MNWVDSSITDYYKWLRAKTTLHQDDATGWSVITTPFIGTFNDPIEIYVKSDGSGVVEMSDDGNTLHNLELTGVNISRSSKRKEWLNYILRNYGVSLRGKELYAETTLGKFPQAKHNFLNAMLEVSDMEMVAQNTVTSMFKDDVRSYFDDLNIIYTPHFIMRGSTGIEFTFDFQLAGRSQETVVRSFNSLNKLNVPNFLFTWQDIKVTRESLTGKKLNSLAIVNDNKDVKTEYISALENKGSEVLLWSRKDENRSKELIEKMVA